MTGNLDIMLYDYENIWENIVYIQAREGSSSGEKQKRRVKKLLKFPPLSLCKKVTERGLSSLKECVSLKRIIATGIDVSIEFKHQFKAETRIQIKSYYF